MAEFAIEAEMGREEWRVRQAVGVAALDELLTGWITHFDGCALEDGVTCDCGLISFAGLMKLVAIDSSLGYLIFRKQ
ncbi:hypothetical protein [Luteimonas kalidii]|uniref:Uncharacterized protein n=1 Tax=Luteimonas kalidii TaxID=3042025 RepID=A0ABT6JUT6_9GAMM|nr:hypothetical protein [Luteimonas kalidii]MDH5834240.1 hypothetical protein [Luteimonas kalidii]